MAKLKHPTAPRLVVYVTACVDRRIPYDLSEDAAMLLQWVEHYRASYEFKVYGFVIMPDHWHALLFTGDKKTMGEIIGEVKRRFSRTIKRDVWQPGFYDRVLRREEHSPAAIEYMHHNPVRAGLVEQPWEWEWSSFANYHGKGETVFPIDHPGPLLWTRDARGSQTTRRGRIG